MKLLSTLVYLILPSILASGFVWLDVRTSLYLIAIHLITVVGIATFFIFRPCRFWALIIGLLVSPLLIFIIEWINYTPDFINYWGTVFITLFYTLPSALLSTILFVIILFVKSIRGKHGE